MVSKRGVINKDDIEQSTGKQTKPHELDIISKKDIKTEIEEPQKEIVQKNDNKDKILLNNYKTDFDILMELVEKERIIKLSKIAEFFKIDNKLANEWGNILNENGLLSVICLSPGVLTTGLTLGPPLAFGLITKLTVCGCAFPLEFFAVNVIL